MHTIKSLIELSFELSIPFIFQMSNLFSITNRYLRCKINLAFYHGRHFLSFSFVLINEYCHFIVRRAFFERLVTMKDEYLGMIAIICTFVLLFDKTRSFETGMYSFGQPTSVDATDRTHYSITTCSLYRLAVTYLTRTKNLPDLESAFQSNEGHCNDLHMNITDQLTKLNFSRWSYQFASREIATANVLTDVRYLFIPYAHFDDERFEEASKFVILQLQAARTSLKRKEWPQARLAIGTLLHSVQDFYSHTNWVELGIEEPNRDLATGRSLGSIMHKNTTACRNCSKTDKNCIENNLFPHRQLTSGYFSFVHPSNKPAGKCSHGGRWDFSLDDDAAGGGINKDSLKADHGYWHIQAASVAYLASVKVLDELWTSTNDDVFGKILGLSNSFSLVFVIDISHRLDPLLNIIRTVLHSLIVPIGHMLVKPHNFIVSPFNGSHWGPIHSVSDIDTLVELFRTLNESDLQYSSEYFYQPLNEALRLCESNSLVFFLTDAPYHPIYSYGRTRALTNLKQARIDVIFLNSSAAKAETVNALKQITVMTGGLFIQTNAYNASTTREFLLHRLDETIGYECVLFESSVNQRQGTFVVDRTAIYLQIKVFSFSSAFSVNLINPTGVVCVPTSSFVGDYLQIFTIDLTNRSFIGQWAYNCSENCGVEINIRSQFQCETRVYTPLFDDDFALVVTPPLVNQYDVFAIITCDHAGEMTNSSIQLIDTNGNMLTNYSIPTLSLSKPIVVPSESFRVRTRIGHRDGTFIYRDERIIIDTSQFLLFVHHQPLIMNKNQTLNIPFSIRNYSPISLRVHLNIDGPFSAFQFYSLERNSTRDGLITMSSNQFEALNGTTRIILLVFALQAFRDPGRNDLGLPLFQHEQIVPLYLQMAEIHLDHPTHFLSATPSIINQGPFQSMGRPVFVFFILVIIVEHLYSTDTSMSQ